MKFRYTGLWLLLAVSLLIITAISFVDDIYIGSVKLKKSPIAENLTKEYKTTEEIQMQKEIALAKAEEKVKPLSIPVDSAPQSFL